MFPTPDLKSATEDDPLESMGTALVVIGVLVSIASLIVGIVLLAHSITLCAPDPYDLTTCLDKQVHPFTGAGVGILLGGAVQAFVIFTLARTARTVGAMRRQLSGVLSPELDVSSGEHRA